MGQNGKHRYLPNKRLTWQRLQKGWSREELVRQIALSMTSHGETDTGLTADTARRWESGDRWPEPRFRRHLVLLFGMPASDLGLLTPDEMDNQPDDSATASDAVVQLLGTGIRRILMAEDQAWFGRQQFLRAMLAAGLTPIVASTAVGEAEAAWRAPGAKRDPRSVAAYGKITATQRELYWTTPAETMLEAALGHLRLGVRLLGSSPAGVGHDGVLASAVAETALLSARIAFFDLGHPGLATQCFDHAEAAVSQAGDHALAAAVAAHHAFIPGFAGDAVTAQSFLEVAQSHGRYGGGPNLRAWMHCVTAEIHARTGQPDSAKERIRQAEYAFDIAGMDPDWLDFFDHARLAGFAGNAELLAGRHEAAARWLNEALKGLDEQDDKQRPVLLFDLAAAHAPTDADHAATLANEACDMLEANFYRTAYERIPQVRHALAGTSGGVSLTERAGELQALAGS